MCLSLPVLNNKILKQTIFLALLLTVLVGCSSKDKTETDDQMQFSVVDSLLGEAIQLEESGLMMSVPAGFTQIPDSIRKIAQQTTKFLSDDSTGTVKVYVNQSHGSGLVISLLPELDLNSDTGKFLTDYYEALVEMHGDEGIKFGDYWINDVLVKNFLITDSQSVMFDLICLTQNRNAMHVQFLVPNKYYTDMIKTLESSIGSISTIK